MLQRVKAISEMTGDKMGAENKPLVCHFYNSGYCKYGGDCKYNHPKESCQINQCKNKRCLKRHPKACRYGHKCRRKSSCLYRHDPQSLIKEVEETEVKKLQVEIEILKEENNEKKKDLQKLANEMAELKNNCDNREKTIAQRMVKDKKGLTDEIEALKDVVKNLQEDLINIKGKIEAKADNKKAVPKTKGRKAEEEKSSEDMSVGEEHELLKMKVFHLEKELEKAVKKIIDLIKELKEANIKRKKEIIPLQTK